MKNWLSENKEWLFSGVVAAIILGLFGLLSPSSNNTIGPTIIFNPGEEKITPKVKEKPKPHVVISEESECITLQAAISMPIEIEKGLCFRNDANTQKATIQLVTRNAIKYTNFKGSFSCYTGETCSLGWPGAPKFHVISDGNLEKKVHIVGEN